MAGINRRKCCCCGCSDLETSASLKCVYCPLACTPRVVRAVLSGITTKCIQVSGGSFYDANGTTLSGTFSLAPQFACGWSVNTPGFDIRGFASSSGSVAGGATCGGINPVSQMSTLRLDTEVISGVTYWRVTISIAPATPYAFYGKTPLADCKTGFTVTNELRSDNLATGGSATITFCP